MDKSQFNKEIDRILKESVALEEKAKLDLETAEFLNNEVIKLETIIDDIKTLPEEKESAFIKLEALHKRLLIELNENTSTQDRLEHELNELNNIIEGSK